MNKFTMPFTEILHENLSIVMCVAYSRKPLNEMVERVFMGEWDYLRKVLFEISAQRAEKACLELALVLRILDDEFNVSKYEKQTGTITIVALQTSTFLLGSVSPPKDCSHSYTWKPSER